MKAIKAAAIALLVVTSAHAETELPACNDEKVIEALKRVLDARVLSFATAVVTAPKDLESDNPAVRWCAWDKLYIMRPMPRGTVFDVIYIIEWMNETEQRFWLQIKSFRSYR